MAVIQVKQYSQYSTDSQCYHLNFNNHILLLIFSYSQYYAIYLKTSILDN